MSIDSFLAGAEGPKKVKIERTSISLPEDMLRAMEDMAFQNKRKKSALNSVSALIRSALQKTYDLS